MKKLTIGLLVDEVDNNFTNEICRGAKKAADELDVNLVAFFGGYLRNQYHNYAYQKNMIFSFAKGQGIDLLIVSIDSVVQGTVDIKNQLLEYFKGIPLVTLNAVYDEYSSVAFDNAVGLEKAIEYLIHNLKKKHFAMLAGTKDNHDANIRRNIFKHVLNKYHLLTSDNQIIYTQSLRRRTEAEVEELLEKNPTVDAIICFNDEVAISTYQVLKRHQIKIGQDIAVLGFDDIHEASRLEPPLSSISAPPSYLGYAAVLRGVEMIKTGQIFHEVLPTCFLLRESMTKDILYNKEFEKNINNCIENHDMHQLWLYVQEFVFGMPSVSLTQELHQSLQTLITDMLSLDLTKPISEKYQRIIKQDMNYLIQRKNIEYIDTNRILSILDMLSQKYIHYHLQSKKDYKVYEDFYRNILKTITLKFDSLISTLTRTHYENNHLINIMSRTMMVFDNQKECYTNILEALKKLNVKNASLLLFENPLRISSYDLLTGHEKLKLVGYIRDQKSVVVSDKIETTIHKLFLKDTIRHYTNNLALTSIYINEIFYGVLLCDMFLESYSMLEYLDIHIGSSLYALNLIHTLDQQSKTDQLTSLYNRRGIFQEIPEFIENKAIDESVYVLYADLDKLKSINDIYGHDEGDLAIKKVGILLKEVFYENAIVGRVGGDEFLVLFKSSIENIEEILCIQLQEKEKELNQQFKRKIDACISYGIKKIDDVHQCHLDEEINCADKLMYVHKLSKRMDL